MRPRQLRDDRPRELQGNGAIGHPQNTDGAGAVAHASGILRTQKLIDDLLDLGRKDVVHSDEEPGIGVCFLFNEGQIGRLGVMDEHWHGAPDHVLPRVLQMPEQHLRGFYPTVQP